MSLLVPTHARGYLTKEINCLSTVQAPFLQLTKSRGTPLWSLLQLSGHPQLVTLQAVQNEVNNSLLHAYHDSEDDDGDNVDQIPYSEEDEDSESNNDDE